jgi:hypothetical protein
MVKSASNMGREQVTTKVDCLSNEQEKDGLGTVTIAELVALENTLHKITCQFRALKYLALWGKGITNKSLEIMVLECQEGIRGLLKLSTGCNRMASLQEKENNMDSTAQRNTATGLLCHCELGAGPSASGCNCVDCVTIL